MKKIVLITGCSSGFGYLLAKRLSTSCTVYATTRASSDTTLLKKIPNIQHLTVDVTNQKECINAIAHITQKEGRLDVLVNNAGYVLGGFFEELSQEEIQAQFDTNFFGVQFMTRAALPLLRQTKGAKIINLSSIAGISSMPCLSAYNASKHALEGFSESLRFELKPFDVDVLLIQPGTFRTKIFEGNTALASNMGDRSSDYYAYSTRILSVLDTFMNRVTSDPDRVAKLIESYVFKLNPPFRTLVGADAKARALLKWLLPFSVYEWLYTKALGRFFR